MGDPHVGDEAENGAALRRRAIRYAEDHAGRLPLVMLVRVARAWELYAPFQNAHVEVLNDHRPMWTTRAALAGYWLVVAGAFPGALALRRRRVALGPLAVHVVVVTLAVAVTWGTARFRVEAEVALVILAGCAASLWRGGGARRRPGG